MNADSIKQRILDTTEFNWVTEDISLNLKDVLFITHCCAKKNSNLTKGTSQDIYISSRNQKFYRVLSQKSDATYCTLSDKYGLISSKQIIENYELAPTDLKPEDIENLKTLIKRQLRKYPKVRTIVYYSHSPMMCSFYLKLLKDLDYKKILITNFDRIKQFKPKTLF